MEDTNARSESVHEKKMFRDSLFTKRCIIPASTYYEWQIGSDRQKTKFLIKPIDDIFYMAGLYNSFQDKDGTKFEGYVVITRPPLGIISHIHNRMPCIIDKLGIKEWLSKDISLDKLQDLLISFNGDITAKSKFVPRQIQLFD